MKKTLYILTIIAVALLNACTTGENVPDEIEDEPIAIHFNAYALRNTRTVANVSNINSVDALAQVGGFGVFAYEHGAESFSDFITEVTHPEFMYNQQVWDTSQREQTGHKGLDTPANKDWTYEPPKFYSNNPNAQHSFFAYAPYSEKVEMAFVLGKGPLIRYSNKQDIDILWAAPTIDKKKPGVTEKVTFDFNHALSKVNFYVAPFINIVHSSGDHNEGAGPDNPQTEPLAEGTTVRVRSIRFVGEVPATAYLNLYNGTWAVETRNEGQYLPNANTEWVGNGTAIPQYNSYAPLKCIPERNLNIEVVYDVITGEGADKSHITNKAVTSQSLNLERGKAYNLYLDLGLTSVKFTASVVDWHPLEEPTDLIWIEAVTCTVLPWIDVDTNPAGGGINTDLEH